MSTIMSERFFPPSFKSVASENTSGSASLSCPVRLNNLGSVQEWDVKKKKTVLCMHLPLMQCDIKVLKRMTILKDLSQHCLVQSVIELAYLNKYFPTNIVHLACFLYLSASVLSIRQPLTVPTSECIRRLVCSTTIPRMTDDGERRKDTE